MKLHRSAGLNIGVLLGVVWILTGCRIDQDIASATSAEMLFVSPTVKLEEKSTQVAVHTIPSLAPIRPTAILTSTPRPSPTETQTPTVTPTATPIGPCTDRLPTDSLLTLITLEYGLSRYYQPADLVLLSEYLPVEVTMGYPTDLRLVAVEPLVEMIVAMQAADLSPTIVSGYRSYAAQSIAWTKWLANEPDRAAMLSAPPGHSEHQLGTTIDFGSPELAEIVGQEDIEFHTYFYKTAVGQWLADHAHEYGFTLSYPREAFELTGFYYEPWHFRYVGPELAAHLKDHTQTLTEYLIETQPVPCVP